MKHIQVLAKIGVLAVIGSMFLPHGATWFSEILNNNSQSLGFFVLLCLLIIAMEHEEEILKAGSKGITGEYVSDSGTKRTAKKLREDHIV